MRWERESGKEIRSRIDAHHHDFSLALEKLQRDGDDTKEARLQLLVDFDARYETILRDQTKVAEDAYHQESDVVDLAITLFFALSILFAVILWVQEIKSRRKSNATNVAPDALRSQSK
jgi:hypothetical protein